MKHPKPRFASKGRLAVRDGRVIGEKPARLSPGKDDALFTHSLQTFIKGQRTRVTRLTAGNVQIIDLSANPDPAAKSQAIEMALSLAEDMMSPLDIIVPCGTDGLILLFDSDTSSTAAEITDALAYRLSHEMRGTQGLSRLKATAHCFDLAAFANLDLIATVEELVAAAQQAFQVYTLERRSSGAIPNDQRLCFGPVIAPQRRLMVGYEVGLCCGQSDVLTHAVQATAPGRVDRREANAAAEQTATIVELLGETMGPAAPIPNVLLFLTVSGAVLDLPLALRNLHHEVAMVSPALQKRLVLTVDMRGLAAPSEMIEAAAEQLSGCGRGLMAYVDEDFGPVDRLAEEGFVGLRVDPRQTNATRSLLTSARRLGLRRYSFDQTGEVSGGDLLRMGTDYVGGPGLLKPVAAPTETLTLH